MLNMLTTHKEKILAIIIFVLLIPAMLRFFKVRDWNGNLIVATRDEKAEDYLDRSGFNPWDDFDNFAKEKEVK